VKEPDEAQKNGDQDLPPGILRLREEWREHGLPLSESRPEADAVVFPEPEAGSAVGDYVLTEPEVRGRLRLSEQAMERLIGSGELDSILVRDSDDRLRRLISVSSFDRFVADSAIELEPQPDMASAAEIETLRRDIDQLKASLVKQIQQMKDMLLLELRNLKEQDRDLASFVFELAQLIEETLPRRKRKGR